MKNILSKFWLINQIVVVGLCVVLQALWLIELLLGLSKWSVWLRLAMWLISVLMVLMIIRFEPKPEVKIAWIILIALLPVLGGMLYIFISGGRAEWHPLFKRLRASERLYGENLRQDNSLITRLGIDDPGLGSLARYPVKTNHMPLVTNTKTTYYRLGDDAWQPMLDDLKKAKRYIFLEYFIIADGAMWQSILDILQRKASEGVDVRIIYDDFGTLGMVPRGFFKKIRALGIECYSFNRFVPLLSVMMNNRDHRKIMVIDGEVAYTGGINLADEYVNKRRVHGHWKDTAVRLEGDAVWSFVVMFLSMWQAVSKQPVSDISKFRPQYKKLASASGYVQPYCDAPTDIYAVGEDVYLNIIGLAQHDLTICTPYLIVDGNLISALQRAAMRGVKVKILTPGVPDKKTVFRLTRSYYAPLIAAGVEIWEYTPGFLHAKSYVCDSKVATVGSINMDYRSLMHHFECGVILYKTDSIKAIERDMHETLAKCRRVSLAEMKLGPLRGLQVAILQIFSPLF